MHPGPQTKDELIDYSIRTGAPLEVVENLQSMEEEGGEIYESIEEIGQTTLQKKTIFGRGRVFKILTELQQKSLIMRLFFLRNF